MEEGLAAEMVQFNDAGLIVRIRPIRCGKLEAEMRVARPEPVEGGR
jgi:hypothetical protein